MLTAGRPCWAKLVGPHEALPAQHTVTAHVSRLDLLQSHSAQMSATYEGSYQVLHSMHGQCLIAQLTLQPPSTPSFGIALHLPEAASPSSKLAGQQPTLCARHCMLLCTPQHLRRLLPWAASVARTSRRQLVARRRQSMPTRFTRGTTPTARRPRTRPAQPAAACRWAFQSQASAHHPCAHRHAWAALHEQLVPQLHWSACSTGLSGLQY